MPTEPPPMPTEPPAMATEAPLMPTKPPAAAFDPAWPYEKHPKVAIRREAFGGLAYHYGNRRLVFLKAPGLVDLVESLAGFPSARDALAAHPPEHGRDAHAKALAGLAASEVIRPRRRSGQLHGGPLCGESPARTAADSRRSALTGQFSRGLRAPICLTWELTYGCNLACVHCLSSSGRRDPRELTSGEARRFIDELHDLQVFYVNIGGGEPMIRPDFFDLIGYAVERGVGVKFSTNGTMLTPAAAATLAGMDYVDVQISIDGADAATSDAVRGKGSYAAARAAMDNLAEAGFGAFKISVVMTRHNISQLGAFERLAGSYGAQLRLTRLRPSGRGADTWARLHPTQEQQRELHSWLLDRPGVLTGDSFFHLSALGAPLPGLNLCGAGRVVCLIDPVGDVYACPFVLHEQFRAGSVRSRGGFTAVWRESPLFADLREPGSAGACASCGSYDACRGGCMASKFFTGLPLDGPDPECVHGHGEAALEALKLRPVVVPHPGPGHSKNPARRGTGREPVFVTLGRRA
jgi:[mycofactocin precursor peptide]-tyrosine decarboxylase / 3-amino-5-[(4-hydroxyphenyl)methyl]-4,4-dimethylpyrrolidin-2-one synthase